jgi:hypothetical protein
LSGESVALVAAPQLHRDRRYEAGAGSLSASPRLR